MIVADSLIQSQTENAFKSLVSQEQNDLMTNLATCKSNALSGWH